MKKNLISIIILALLIVNIVLTSIMMFSVTGSARKTSALVTDISAALKLELTGTSASEGEAAAAPNVSIANIDVYNIAEAMTIPVKIGEDGQQHYCVVQISLSMDKKNKGYKKYSDLTVTEALIQDEILAVFGQYTIEEIKSNPENTKQDILKRLHAMYESDFIYSISYRDIKYS